MISAVPAYLGDQFDKAPPGHRFSLYFPVWRPESWEIEKTKAPALKKILTFPAESRHQIDVLRERQQSLLLFLDGTLCFMLEAVTTAPLVTGMGMEHPLENGFAFLNPYGIPYLPGSSIKGVLRRAAEELIEAGDAEWIQDSIDTLFGHEDSNNARRGALTFWDSIPEIKGNTLFMDVMTPHYGKYYQGEESPHDAGQPIPIVFMAIPPDSKFSFHVTADEKRMPESLKDGKWKTLLEVAYQHAFDWLGFGAKTAVGYGAVRELTKEEIEAARVEAKTALLHCGWVDENIKDLADTNNAKPSDILRGKLLAQAWSALEDHNLKEKALADIRTRWEKEGWWGNPTGKSMKAAKAIYTGEA